MLLYDVTYEKQTKWQKTARLNKWNKIKAKNGCKYFKYKIA